MTNFEFKAPQGYLAKFQNWWTSEPRLGTVFITDSIDEDFTLGFTDESDAHAFFYTPWDITFTRMWERTQ